MVNQFDVYWVDLNPTVGAEIQKVRPCVVVSPKELNQHLATVIIIPITSAIHDYPFRVRCHVDGREGEIVRLKKKITTLSLDEQTELQDVLRQMFCE